MATKQETDQRILTAFSELVLKYGYHGTTTRKIADRAGVNESTVFRHFKDKHHLLDQLIELYIEDIDKINKTFQVDGDIETDLQRVAELYADFIQRHQAVSLLGVKEGNQFPEIRQAVKKLPLQFAASLTNTFNQMVASGEINAQVNVPQEVSNFILINFGNAVFNDVYSYGELGIPLDRFVAENIKTFAQHLK
ncbi:TetR/AcrR family transcriptional regulator [Levilactobacillus acidifarinae]|uniref:Transcriptional regulator n=1 Tax=Levilactobacillus acidifarinae DSM 19394 = JCM 15949 TaxID=1423715 RepID=A0A0R1LLZ9_9LACO|nr:TetR/AcrR family transcriptional regulator [Levilactobacillus acidifarinae]KRK94068.1 transcriptional regulator [Levilactobacillus acidifarinae DSM 19394]GEO69765.1 hypothetical protein LAC03_16750 [Levilactobacillus acidifarinae]